MTPIDAFATWLTGRVPGYVVTRGPWREDAAQPGDRFISLWANPGRNPSGDAGYAIIRVIATGRRQEPGDVVEVERAIESIAAQAIDDYRTDCIGNIRAMSFPAGPFFTDENRVFYELNFEILMRI